MDACLKQFTLYKVTDILLIENEAIHSNNAKQQNPLSLSEKLITQVIIQPDCIAFYQLRRLLEQDIEVLPDGTGDLRRHFVSVSFGNKAKPSTQKQLFSHGFSIDFGDETIAYIRFEMSSNMSRNGNILYIDSNLHNKVNESITIGWKPKDSIHTSKWMAYKGLCLSSGESPFNESITVPSPYPDGVPINIENPEDIIDYIIVVPDDIKAIYGFTMLSPMTSADVTIQKENNYKVNLSDGAGLISWELAELIGIETSFQFRLPFCKGMLHKVKIHYYFKTLLNIDFIYDVFGTPHDISKVLIILTVSQFKAFQWFDIDYLASPNLLQKNKPTQKRKIECNVDDVNIWSDYRERFKKYKHRLFISQRAKPDIYCGDSIPLNYQILSTLVLTPDDEKVLLQPSVERYLKLKNDYRARLIEYTNPIFEEADEDGEQTDTAEREETIHQEAEELVNDETSSNNSPEKHNSQSSISTNVNIIEVLAFGMEKNAKYVAEPQAVSLIESKVSYQLDEIAKGRLIVRGKSRYLAPDLLSLLVSIAQHTVTYTEKNQKINTDHPDIKKMLEILEQHMKKCLKSSDVFIPHFTPERLSENDPFLVAIARNPHISRNEHIIAKTRNSEFYNELFGHLDRVCMLNTTKDLHAQRLGGADFDGDMVKITDNPIYIKGVGQTTRIDILDPNGTTVSQKTEITLPPLVDIDYYAKSEDKQKTPRTMEDKDSPWLTFRNSKENNIGLLSNFAIFLAEKAFTSNPDSSQYTDDERQTYQQYLSLLTIYIGQEIDKVKTGVEPKLDENKGFFELYKNYGRNNVVKPNILLIKDSIDRQRQSPHWRSRNKLFAQPDPSTSFLGRLRTDATALEETIFTEMSFPKKLKTPKLIDLIYLPPEYNITVIDETVIDEKRKKLCALYFAYIAVKSEQYYGEVDLSIETEIDIEKPDPYGSSYHYTTLLTILRRQRGNIGGDDREHNAEGIIKSIVDAFHRCIGLSKSKSLLKAQHDMYWAFTPKVNRMAKLKEILGDECYASLEKFEDSKALNTSGFVFDEFISFITDFSFSGYDTFSYLLKTANYTHIFSQVNKAQSQSAIETATAELEEYLAKLTDVDDVDNEAFPGIRDLEKTIEKKKKQLASLEKQKNECFGKEVETYNNMITMYTEIFRKAAYNRRTLDYECQLQAEEIFKTTKNKNDNSNLSTQDQQLALVNTILKSNIIEYDKQHSFFWCAVGNVVYEQKLVKYYREYSIPRPLDQNTDGSNVFEYMFRKYTVDERELSV